MDIGMTLLGQALSFAILIWFTVKFIWPPLMAAIEERQQKIAEGLAAADRSKKDLAQAEEQVNEVLREARGKATEIITQAETRRAPDHRPGQGRSDRGRQSAEGRRDGGNRLRSTKAREDLRKQVSALAVAGAEKLIMREIDGNAHRALLDELAAEI